MLRACCVGGARKGPKGMTGVEEAVSDGRGKSGRPLSRVSAKAAQGVTSWLDNVDRRGLAARRFRDQMHEVTTDESQRLEE